MEKPNEKCSPIVSENKNEATKFDAGLLDSLLNDREIFPDKQKEIHFKNKRVHKNHDWEYIVPTSSDNFEVVINLFDDFIYIKEKKDGSEDLIASIGFNKNRNGLYCYSYRDEEKEKYYDYLDDDDDIIEDSKNNFNQSYLQICIVIFIGIISSVATSLFLNRK